MIKRRNAIDLTFPPKVCFSPFGDSIIPYLPRVSISVKTRRKTNNQKTPNQDKKSKPLGRVPSRETE